MLFNCKCLECNKYINVLFDFRYAKEKQIELYVIENDGNDPKPTGYCGECVKDAIGRDLDLIVSKLNGTRTPVYNIGQQRPHLNLAAGGMA
jgi:hypothetical protein